MGFTGVGVHLYVVLVVELVAGTSGFWQNFRSLPKWNRFMFSTGRGPRIVE